MPEPLLPVAIEATAKADEDKLRQALQRLAAEDPTLRIEHNAETAPDRALVHGRGARRRAARPAREPLRRRSVDQVDVQGAAARDVRAARPRDTGGTSSSPAGTASTPSATSTWSRCPRAAASSSSTRSSAAPCPDSSSRASRRACGRRWSAGVAPGYPVVDLRVTLTDGKAHSVDSSDMAFQMAGALALREAAAGGARSCCSSRRRGRACSSPTTYVGTVMSDLSGTARPAARHRAGRRRPHAGPRRGAADRARPLRHRPPRVQPRRRHRSPGPSRATSRCPTTWPRS